MSGLQEELPFRRLLFVSMVLGLLAGGACTDEVECAGESGCACLAKKRCLGLNVCVAGRCSFPDFPDAGTGSSGGETE